MADEAPPPTRVSTGEEGRADYLDDLSRSELRMEIDTTDADALTAAGMLEEAVHMRLAAHERAEQAEARAAEAGQALQAAVAGSSQAELYRHPRLLAELPV